MNIYADTSVFVALHLTEVHSGEARRRMARGRRMWLTSLHRAEWAHAIAQHVFRGVLSDEDASRFYIAFEADREAKVWADISIPDAAYETAMELARKHGPQIPMKTLDTLHVACALELGAREFWTFDERQAKLAKAAGLTVS